MRRNWERWAGVAGFAFVALYIAAFALGIEVGDSDEEIRDYYASSAHRTKEIIAFFLIGGAALSLIMLASGLRSLLAKAETEPRTLTAITWAGAVSSATLILVGDAVSRTPAFASLDYNFTLDPNAARLLNDMGFLLYASAALAAILLVAGVSLAVLRHGILPRWVGWAGFPLAALLLLGIAFVGFLVFALWVLLVSVILVFRRRSPRIDNEPELARLERRGART